MDNVTVQVEDLPPPGQPGLLGLYRGVPLSQRGRGYTNVLPDTTTHAEMLSIRDAASVTEGWRLDGCTLFVTLEPCAMCAGAIVLARLDRVVFGAADPKAGFAGSLGNLVKDPRLNHEATVIPGVLAEECGDLLRAFFQARR